MVNIIRPFPDVWHVYFMCMHVKYMCIQVKYMCYTPGNGLVMFASPKNPQFNPSFTIQSKVTVGEILSLKPREYT